MDEMVEAVSSLMASLVLKIPIQIIVAKEEQAIFTKLLPNKIAVNVLS